MLSAGTRHITSWFIVPSRFPLGAAKPDDGSLPIMDRLTDDLIVSQVPPGSPVGDSYEWLDDDVEPGLSYLYWLEAVDVYGTTEMLDVVTTTVPAIYRTFVPSMRMDNLAAGN